LAAQQCFGIWDHNPSTTMLRHLLWQHNNALASGITTPAPQCFGICFGSTTMLWHLGSQPQHHNASASASASASAAQQCFRITVKIPVRRRAALIWIRVLTAELVPHRRPSMYGLLQQHQPNLNDITKTAGLETQDYYCCQSAP
jgi:hypothetical protein